MFKNFVDLIQNILSVLSCDRQQFEMQLLQEMQKQQHFLRLQQSQVNDEKKRSRTDLAEKHGKPEQGPKNSGQVSSVFQRAHAWQQQQQHSKAPNVSSYYPANVSDLLTKDDSLKICIDSILHQTCY